MTLLAFVATGIGLLAAAAIPYLLVEKRWRWRWREVESGRLPAAAELESAYRGGGTVPAFLTQAPPLVRATAYSCLFFGQMFIPGLCMGAFGLVAGGLGLVSIPGLIVAAKLWMAGLALLRRTPRDAYFRARSAALWALWLNGIIMGLSIVFIPFVLRAESSSFRAGYFGTAAFFDAYGVLSIAQALLLLRTARRYEDAFFQGSEAVQLPGRPYPMRAAA